MRHKIEKMQRTLTEPLNRFDWKQMRNVCGQETYEKRRESVSPFVRSILETDPFFASLEKPAQDVIHENALNVAVGLVELHVDTKTEASRMWVRSVLPSFVVESSLPNWTKKVAGWMVFGTFTTALLAAIFSFKTAAAAITVAAILKALGITKTIRWTAFTLNQIHKHRELGKLADDIRDLVKKTADIAKNSGGALQLEFNSQWNSINLYKKLLKLGGLG